MYLHLMFELIWRYRFFYRDLSDLLSRNRKLELHFKQILAHKIKVARQLCEGLRSEQSLQASDAEINALATNMVVVATYWLSYEYVNNPRQYTEQQAMADGVLDGVYAAEDRRRGALVRAAAAANAACRSDVGR